MIRGYYIDLEDMIKLYMKYQSLCRERESQRKITSLEDKLDKMQLTMDKMERQNTTLLTTVDNLKSQNAALLEQGERQLEQQDEIQDQLFDVTDKLAAVLPDRAIHPHQPGKQDKFTLLKRVSNTGGTGGSKRVTYYVIRGQKTHTVNTITRFKKQFDVTVLLEFERTPNSISLFNIIKNEMKNAGQIGVSGNIIILHTISEQILVDSLKTINDSRKIIE